MSNYTYPLLYIVFFSDKYIRTSSLSISVYISHLSLFSYSIHSHKCSEEALSIKSKMMKEGALTNLQKVIENVSGGNTVMDLVYLIDLTCHFCFIISMS